MPNAREILIETSRRLNEGIRALEAAIQGGGAAPESIDVMRREAAEAMARLRSVQGAGGLVGETIPKVAQHLDLFMEIASSAGSAPVLSRKLLRHLLDEQLELTALAEREGFPSPGSPAAGGGGRSIPDARGSPRGAGDRGGRASSVHEGPMPAAPGASAASSTERPGPASPATPGAALPGGRRALTVGSLIGT